MEETELRMGAEDFAFYSQQKPVCFLRLGVRNEEKGIIYGVHHPKFDIDPASLLVGMRVISMAVI